MSSPEKTISASLNRNLIFIHGKGGVGKTTVSRAIAMAHAEKGVKTLWVTIEDPAFPRGETCQIQPSLWHLNCDFTMAFEEYASMKIGIAKLTRLFLQNKVMRYLSRAAPGVHELVLLGKIWYERTNYNHIIVDLPSTGHGLAMFQSVENFSKLFKGGPLYRDAEAMLSSLRDPKSSGHLILSLPEEMPLRESIELNQYLEQILVTNSAVFIVNRVFPHVPTPPELEHRNSHHWATPLAQSAEDYAIKRNLLEKHNLRLWKEEGIKFGELSFVPPPLTHSTFTIAEKLAKQFQDKGYL